MYEGDIDLQLIVSEIRLSLDRGSVPVDEDAKEKPEWIQM